MVVAHENTNNHLGTDPDSDIPYTKNEDCHISPSALKRAFHGIVKALRIDSEPEHAILNWISAQEDAKTSATLPLLEWRVQASSQFAQEPDIQQVIDLALGIAYLQYHCRDTHGNGLGVDIDFVWGLIRNVLNSPLCQSNSLCSAQGFIFVPLCSLLTDNQKIDELWRLHIWLPDGKRGNRDFRIHSHQAFAQSWILGGEGRDESFNIEPVEEQSTATHAKYSLVQNSGKSETVFIGRGTSSTISNTGELVRVSQRQTDVHTRGMRYTIPAAAFHASEVVPDRIHATLFVFDSHRGYVETAPVLGPKDGTTFTNVRYQDKITPAILRQVIDKMQTWEDLTKEGKLHAQRAEWEDALRQFDRAYNLCNSSHSMVDMTFYKCLTLGDLGRTNRRFGRYEQAQAFLIEALEGMHPCQERVELSGELGVVYRQMNNFIKAKHALEDQYNTAEQLDFDMEACRAIGNLGMVNYQLYLENHDEELLVLATKQLSERVQRARAMKAMTWEIVGLSRLSLCYIASGHFEKAVSAASQALEITKNSVDSTVVAISRFFLGHALLQNGRREEALEHFNPPDTCTPAMALCKEPSEEHRQYLQELVDTGVDLDLIDEHGYTALDYAVFSRDTAMQEIVTAGLSNILHAKAERELTSRVAEARARKGYREIFQNELRPVLLAGQDQGGLQRLRKVYANALAVDDQKRSTFDSFKYVRYTDFQNFGRLPRSSDGLSQRFTLDYDETQKAQGSPNFILFLSYRWINSNKNPSGNTVHHSPDDEHQTQYRRMLQAIQDFLKLHPSINAQNIGIWMDYACIDQSNPQPGVLALPMIVAQCDAMISLVDGEYYERAWCSVEIQLVTTLRKSYNLHLWYEQVATIQVESKGTDRSYILREGPLDYDFSMAEKKLSFEVDRPKVLFLERQTKLLG